MRACACFGVVGVCGAGDSQSRWRSYRKDLNAHVCFLFSRMVPSMGYGMGWQDSTGSLEACLKNLVAGGWMGDPASVLTKGYWAFRII